MNLPFMADYANNHHFKNYIPDRDINDKILTKNSVPSNLQEVPVLGDFMKTLLVSQTVITTDHQMRKFQEKHLQVMGPLSRASITINLVCALLKHLEKIAERSL